MRRFPILSGFALIATLASAPLAGVDGGGYSAEIAAPAAADAEKSPLPVPVPPNEKAAPVALLIDLSSGQTLFERDSTRRFVPASLTKVMTLFTAFELMKAGAISPDQRIIITPGVAREWSGRGSSLFLKAGDNVSIDQLLHGIATVSANDGSISLAQGAAGSVEKWTDLMNGYARDLGMADSHFSTPNGWMDEGRTFTTAHDLALLGRAMVERHPWLYQRYIGKKALASGGIAQQNHDPLIGVFQGADGIKTGFTRQAGYGYLGSAEQGGRRLMMVVAASPSDAARAKSAKDLMNWGFAAFSSRKMLDEGATVAEARIQGGAQRSVKLIADRALFATLPRNAAPQQTRYQLHYEGPLEAPISSGQLVAQLEITTDGSPPITIPLYAGNDIARANSWQRLRNGLMGLVS